MTAEHGSHRPEVQVVDRHVACVMTADDTVRAAVRRLYRHALGFSGGSGSGSGSGSESGSESESENESGSGTASAAWQLSADQHAAVAQMLQCACAEVQHGTAGGFMSSSARGSRSSVQREVEADAAAAGSAGSAEDHDHDQRRVSVEAQLQHAEAVLSQRTGRFVLVLECVADQSNRFGIYRTAEALGVHEVWVILPPKARASRRTINAVSKKAQQWLSVRHFASTE